MTKVTSVRKSTTRPNYTYIDFEVTLDNEAGSGVLNIQFLGANQAENPTKFVVAANMYNGISIADPTINSDDNTQIDINVIGEAVKGEGSLAFIAITSEGTDPWQFEVSLNVNGSRVTYKFKKKRGR
jgi:plastocyanin domain-containing protein